MNVTINEGTAFVVSDETGDIVPGKEDGLYEQDTRFLSKYLISMDDVKPVALAGREVSYHSAVHYLTNPVMGSLQPDLVSIERKRFVRSGFHEEIQVTNFGRERVRFRLRLEFDTDFANIFDVKRGQIPRGMKPATSTDEERRSISFSHREENLYRETRILFGELVEIEGGAGTFVVDLGPKEVWRSCVDVLALTSPEARTPEPCGSFDDRAGARPLRESWIRRAPKLFTDYDALRHAYDQTLADMAALRLRGPAVSKTGIIPAAGLPWYYTCFGRDSLIAAYQTLPYLPEMADGVLRNLAKYQGRRVDPDIEEEPGKILHEIRWSGITPAGRTGYDIYYGTVDATPLFVIVLSELYKWTSDRRLVEDLESNLVAAVDWLDRYGDKDHDGYVEYAGGNRRGLANQGWKDSHDSVSFADGRLAEPPIALCEVQGYVHAAKLGAAGLFDLLDRRDRADELRQQASGLKKNFNRDFWMPDAGCYAEGLDKRKKQIDSVTSNAGQLLWTGIVDEDKAGALRERILASDMFTGWGIRTLSSKMGRYNSVSYHNGSVWPHDNSLIAAGLMAHGFDGDGIGLMGSLLDAGQYFAYQRLPELFCGFDRRASRVPIEYPAASSPQAWASGASMLMLTTILGMKADAPNKRLSLDPHFPPGTYRFYLAGLRIGDSYLSFEVLFERGQIEVNIMENPGSYKIRLETRRVA